MSPFGLVFHARRGPRRKLPLPLHGDAWTELDRSDCGRDMVKKRAMIQASYGPAQC